MPLIYADTSALFAYFHPRDEFAKLVTAAVRETAADFAYWQLLRFELRHNLRLANTDKHGATAWQALRAAEKTTSRLRWQDLDASRMIESADELSAEKSAEIFCGSTDILHVVAARRMKRIDTLDEFWTCDHAQAALAVASGLQTRLFELNKPAR